MELPQSIKAAIFIVLTLTGIYRNFESFLNKPKSEFSSEKLSVLSESVFKGIFTLLHFLIGGGLRFLAPTLVLPRGRALYPSGSSCFPIQIASNTLRRCAQSGCKADTVYSIVHFPDYHFVNYCTDNIVRLRGQTDYKADT